MILMKKTLFGMFILILILLFHGINNYYILSKSRYCLCPDSVSNFGRTYSTSKIFMNIKLNPRSFKDAYVKIFQDTWKPPLFFITAAPFFLISNDKNVVVMVNLIYFLILLLSTYGIGKQMYNEQVGLLAAFLLSMFPTTFALSRLFMLDFSLSAMVALSFYLFTLNRFASLKFSLLTGIVIGLGALIKQSYFVFVMPYLLYFLFRKGNLKNRIIIRNFILSIFVAVLILSHTYYTLLSHAYLHDIFVMRKDVSPYYYPYYYLTTIFNRQLLPYFSLLFLFSFFYFFKKRDFLLPLMVLIPLVIFSVPPNKADRFIFPIFIYIALMISVFMLSLPKMRRVCILGLVLFSFFQYFIICYGDQGVLPELKRGGNGDRGIFSIVDEGDWQSPCEEIIKVVTENITNKDFNNKEVKVFFIGQNFNIPTTIDFAKITRNLAINLLRSDIDAYFLFHPEKKDLDFNSQVSHSDFLIIEEIKTEEQWIHTRYLLNAFRSNSNKFKFIKNINFPDNTLCYFYKNNNL